MIDFDNLRTASLYINNQLLSRGLLRDGRGIDFADPGDSDYELADTMGRIIGVVNDLILRRDRDAEHRESLSTTLRTLRADSLRQSDNFSRLQEKYTEAQRKISLHEAEDNAARAQLKAAEATIHKLKEEAARMKKLVAETRATCANEVRKRDRQIDGLKKAASEAGRARGERKGPGITTIHVTGVLGGEDVKTASASTMDEDYDLRQETNDFLAQLAKGLNEENESLLALLRKTGDNLKEMSGWEKTEAAAAAPKRDTHVLTLVTSPEEISADIDAVLGHLRTMLTNPSFVPLEEVVVREEEILRLRDGWEKMETRWRETVQLIDGWHRRMAANGRPIDMEDLKMGLRLSPEADFQEEEESDMGQQRKSPSPAESLHLVPAPGYEDGKAAPLEESNMAGNRKAPTKVTGKSRKRSGEFMTENADEVDEQPPIPPPHGTKEGESPKKRLKVSADPQDDKPDSRPNSAVFTHTESSHDSLLKSTPTRQPTRQQTTRATAATTSSSARTTGPKSAEKTRSRAQPAASTTRTTSTTTDMPPPTRPNKSAYASPNNHKPLPPPPPTQETKSAPSSTSTQPTAINASVSAEQATSLGESRRPAAVPAAAASDSPTRVTGKATSRLPLPRNAGPLPQPQQSPLTMARIAAKLAASEREADAARVKAKLRAARLNKSIAKGPAPQGSHTSAVAESSKVPSDGGGDPVKRHRRALSGSSAVAPEAASGTTGSGPSYRTDENGERGGASVRDGHAAPSVIADEGGVDVVTDDGSKHHLAHDEDVNGDHHHPEDNTAVQSPRKAPSPARKSSPAKGASATKPRKREVRSRAERVANRRRSTLSPWELQSLIAGEVVPPTPSPRKVQAEE
ncbi:hypothetical protein VPNG_05432 [Cytospora leucostoma]|uniref:NIMA interactive protein n=1 Tax=Cytospora leucostoma TaxID=1230097 RepID=A0A423XBS0_9PEZI|nr:hypothetical protein VPNG_05432 [Cytospora leucostoma]